MRSADITTWSPLALTPDDYTVLGPADFGAPGVQATEIIGPYVRVQAHGPLITVHDSILEPHRGVGHHPHRYNERIFYIMTGELDHSDTRNDITGHMGTGDVGLFTEGRIGMVHSEWNNGDAVARAFILVYPTEPMPERAAFEVLPDARAPRYDESSGVRTKEMLGSRSPLRIHGDVRFFADSQLDAGARVAMQFPAGEGGLLFVVAGVVSCESTEMSESCTLLYPPADSPRSVSVIATAPSRVLRVVHGPGFGLRAEL